MRKRPEARRVCPVCHGWKTVTIPAMFGGTMSVFCDACHGTGLKGGKKGK
jgi:DnaJ-class molecular chaperone